MAKLKKNGHFSGMLNNLVFVDSDERSYVRTKPDRVKQSPQTKTAASTFGFVSTREKSFRLRLLRLLQLPAPQYFAARHRARLQKTVTSRLGSSTSPTPAFADPVFLTGFDFNPKMEWQRHTNFYTEIVHEENQIRVSIPDIKWKQQIKPPKNCVSAVLALHAVAADLNQSSVEFTELAALETTVSGNSAVPAQEWLVSTAGAAGWLLITASLKFKTSGFDLPAKHQFSATYLWAGNNPR